MSPSRGSNLLLSISAFKSPSTPNPKWHIRFQSSLHQIPNANTQIYLSRTRSPYLNLSIEHHLLTKSPPHSTILFLYTNSPSIIIGRNQNPWVECNLSLQRNSPLNPELVRRRSGGGTVWHDEGNVNYSVICPTGKFDRDIHAQMVVRALRSLHVKGVRVNERHDIVLDSPGEERPLKVSGSAYKLTRLRSVHHGTCLLNSPNLGDIGKFLKSPAKKYIKARGVDSVSSPIANVEVQNGDFEEAVIREFKEMYGVVEPVIIGEEEGSVPEIMKGVNELKSPDWIYGQTPQFRFSYPTRPATEELPEGTTPKPKQSLPLYLSFVARNAIISTFQTVGNSKNIELDTSEDQLDKLSHCIVQDWSQYNLKVHEIKDWSQHVVSEQDLLQGKGYRKDFVMQLNRMFGLSMKD